MRLYICGPMTGYPNFNFPAFEEAANDLRRQNYVVWSPHESDLEKQWAERNASVYDPDNGTSGEGSHRFFLATDLREVCLSDELAVLDGWEASLGCRIETYVAFQLGIPVKAYEYGVPFTHAYEFQKYHHPHIIKE